MTAIAGRSILAFDAAQAAPFFEHLATLGQIHLVAITPDSGSVVGLDFGTDAIGAQSWAKTRNNAGANIYWSVNLVRSGLHGKPKKGDIEGARFAHVDIDPPQQGGWDRAERLRALAEQVEPSFVIDSGNGYQAFWQFDGTAANADAIEAINRGIRDAFGADHCWNIDRLMRLPGAVNWPDAKKRTRGRLPVVARVEVPFDGLEYDPSELALRFPEVVREPQEREAARYSGPIDLMTADDLDLGPFDPIRIAIEHPPGIDRSGDALAAARVLSTANYSDATIMGVLLNSANAAARHCTEQRNPLYAASRCLQRARSGPSAAHGAEQARRLIEAAACNTDSASDIPATLTALDWHALASEPLPAREWALAGMIPHNEVTLLSGPGGAGKSYLGQQLATCIAAGIPFLGMAVRGGVAVYVTAEDDTRELRFRQSKIGAHLDVDVLDIADRLHIVTLRGAEGNELCLFDHDGKIRATPTFDKLLATIEATGASFVVLDNVAHLFTGNENDRGQVTRFANLLNRLAGRGVAVLLVAHPNKSGDSYSGSTAWLNAVRSHLTLDYQRDEAGDIPDRDARVLSIGEKANYASADTTIKFRWHDHALVLDGEIEPALRERMAATLRATGDNDLFLACLRERNRQERPVSENKASRTYAALKFAAMVESKGIGKARLEAAMDRLFRLGAIERGFVCRKDRKDRDGLRVRADVGADPATDRADECADPRADPALSRCADVRVVSAPTCAVSHPSTYGTTGGPLEAAPPVPDASEGQPTKGRVVFPADDLDDPDDPGNEPL